jgi:hypothetical protein
MGRTLGTLVEMLGRSRTAALVLAALQPACTSIDDLRLAGADGGGNCVHAEIPSEPSLAAHIDGSIEFVVAVRAFDLGDLDGSERFRSMGYDLDGKCTGQGQGSSCIKPTWATAEDRDDPQGRDNSYGAQLYALRADGGSSGTESGNTSIDSGLITSVFRVKGYNGTSLDPEVEVAVYGATMNGGGTTEARPKWEGEDVWAAHTQWLDPEGTAEYSVERPKYYDAKAYVNNSILVAQFDQYFVPVMTLSQVKLTARIVWKDERWFLVDGTTAGRAKTDEILWTVGFLRDPDTRGFVCTDSPNYQTYKQSICSASDISYAGPDDGSAPCDATSWAWKFEAEPARLSGVYNQRVLPTCPPQNDPSTDNCSTLGVTQTRSRTGGVDAGSAQ